jgi:predicted AAA+ superfamily ATPase
MTAGRLTELGQQLHTLTVFRSLLNDPVIRSLQAYLEGCACDAPVVSADRYCAFVSILIGSHVPDLAGYIQSVVNDDENVYIRAVSRKQTVAESLSDAVRCELGLLQQIANLTPDALTEPLNWSGYLPSFETGPSDISGVYMRRTGDISRFGYGIWSRYYMFHVDDEGTVIPVVNPDTQRLSDLIDYKREQGIIMDNTRALLAGKPAANILLTGDAGTGKSSTIKAVVNELKDEGLRILEVRKEQLKVIPSVMGMLSENPLKFILFIDDLSFQSDDDNFAAFKAILEGSVSAKSRNVAIYATSNRRHMVRESFSGRAGDDIHRNDTMQETVSLSERFGIQVLFRRPDKFTYLNIVRHLAEQAGLDIPQEELELGAERFALTRANRSARAARQYVDSLIAAKE